MVWDRKTGEPVHNAIVWQDRRTAKLCAQLKEDGCEKLVRERTGLILDPYFSGTKLKWILDEVDGVRARAEKGELAFGTIDSFLLWRLTGGKVHATDASNASRTLLFDIHKGAWDADMLKMLDIPESLLPEVKDNSDDLRRDDEPICSARACRSAAWRATSRPRSWARPASSAATRSRPTAPAASYCSTPARRR